MQYINDHTTQLRQNMAKVGIPDFTIGTSVGFSGDVNYNASYMGQEVFNTEYIDRSNADLKVEKEIARVNGRYGEEWYGNDGGILLNNFNDGLNAVGIFAGSAELFTNANAGARIAYTTFNGTSAWVSSAKVVSGFKAAGNFTFGASIAIDFSLSFIGQQSWGTTTVNTSVGGVAIAIGGVPGLVVGVGYTVLDKTGMFDRPTGPIPHYKPGFAVPDATRVAPPIIKY